MGHGVGEAEKKAKELVERMVRWVAMAMEMVGGVGSVTIAMEMGWYFFGQQKLGGTFLVNRNGVVLFWSTELVVLFSSTEMVLL